MGSNHFINFNFALTKLRLGSLNYNLDEELEDIIDICNNCRELKPVIIDRGKDIEIKGRQKYFISLYIPSHRTLEPFFSTLIKQDIVEGVEVRESINAVDKELERIIALLNIEYKYILKEVINPQFSGFMFNILNKNKLIELVPGSIICYKKGIIRPNQYVITPSGILRRTGNHYGCEIKGKELSIFKSNIEEDKENITELSELLKELSFRYSNSFHLEFHLLGNLIYISDFILYDY